MPNNTKDKGSQEVHIQIAELNTYEKRGGRTYMESNTTKPDRAYLTGSKPKDDKNK